MGSFATVFKKLSATQDMTQLKTDVLVIPVFQAKLPFESTTAKSKSKKSSVEDDAEKATYAKSAALKTIDKALSGYVFETLDAEKYTAASSQRRVFHVSKNHDLKAKWVVIVGLGEADKLKLPKLTQAVRTALKETFKYDGVHDATILLPTSTKHVSTLQALQCTVFASIQSTYKTQEAGEKKLHKLKSVSFIPEKGQTIETKEIEAARVMALAEAFAKDLANRPANLKRAEDLAAAARSFSDLPGVTVEVVSDLKKIRKEMPAFWAVGQAAEEVDPPRFIKVTYQATATKKPKKKIALVGKGVIFDTGGVQVKPGASMNDMKFDMTGAASVLATIKAAAELGLKGIHVAAYVAATANLTGEKAYLPDSIIDSASGRKIEIRHTDAEGRVTLADSVYKAVQDKPDEIITIATLTGTAMMAVGHCTALMGTDDDLLKRIETRGKAVGEPIQQLDFMDQDFEDIKSDRDSADLSNTGKGKTRGHMTAGAFVLTFAEEIPAAHLDIAGGDAKDGNATGIAVKGLIAFLRQEAVS